MFFRKFSMKVFLLVLWWGYAYAVGSGSNFNPQYDSSVKAGPAFKSHSNPFAAQDLVIPRKKQKSAHLSPVPIASKPSPEYSVHVRINDKTYHLDPSHTALGSQGGVAFGISSSGERIIIKQLIDRRDFSGNCVEATKKGNLCLTTCYKRLNYHNQNSWKLH